MREKLVYDLPTRAFHWLFATCFVVAFAIGNTVDDESALFSYHMLAGLMLSFLVVWRLVWGFIGTTHARFSDFSLRPRELANYFRGLLSKDQRTWRGHNPASSWAAVTMMSLAVGLGITGYLMRSGLAGEDLEEVHELLANGFLLVVLLHLAGIVLHTSKHRDPIWKSMLDGQKLHVPEASQPISPRRVSGVFFLALSLGFAIYLLQNFNADTRELNLFGSRLYLSEAEEGDGGDRHSTAGHHSHEDHEEDDD
ncbi:MAG: cytochrome b [Gammaproteobacteria bacterium]|nr:MAG: cytochrome b [Gammaproteobacteria bacterium]